jgi:hypothetical protein
MMGSVEEIISVYCKAVSRHKKIFHIHRLPLISLNIIFVIRETPNNETIVIKLNKIGISIYRLGNIRLIFLHETIQLLMVHCI